MLVLDKFNKLRHVLGKLLQIMVLLKMIIWLKKIKKTIVTKPHSSRKDKIFKIWHFHAKTPNSDLNINNNMANKKMIKN